MRLVLMFLFSAIFLAPPREQAAFLYSGPMDIAPWFPPNSYPSWIDLDINSDGTDDFRVEFFSYITPSHPLMYVVGHLSITELGSNAVLRGGSYASALDHNQPVPAFSDPSADWTSSLFSGNQAIAFEYGEVDLEESTASWSGWQGPMAGLGNGFLALYFHAADGPHYGWLEIELNTQTEFDNRPVIRSWAYETEPGVTLMTIPEPRTLWLVLAALAGMGVWRRIIRPRALRRDSPFSNRHSAIINQHS
jgi:hypothetical protein